MSIFQITSIVIIVAALTGLIGFLIGMARVEREVKEIKELYKWKTSSPPIHPHCRCIVEPEVGSETKGPDGGG